MDFKPGRHRTLLLIALLLLAAITLFGFLYTSNPDQGTNMLRRRRRTDTERQTWSGQRTLETAAQFAKLANTRDEDRLAREAVQLADHELDLAFTTALRDAQLNPAPVSQQTKDLHSRIRDLEIDIKGLNDRVLKITTAMNSAKPAEVDSLQQQLDLVESQLTLSTEELEDAKQDLLRTGDDVETRVQRMIEAHKSAYHGPAEPQTSNVPRLPPFAVPTTLAQQLRTLQSQREKQQQLTAAQQTELTASQGLDKKHDELELQLKKAAGSDAAHPQSQIAAIDRLSEERKLLADYGRRLQDKQQLAQVYGNWVTLLNARQVAVLHGVLRSVLFILLILVFVVLGDAVVDRALGDTRTDRRRNVTIRMIVRFGIRFVVVMLILFVVFGTPSELSTIVGLATAGLTVALKDFIVAFFGWFVLMGRNGIRVGDWVEINGISGEVAEVGLLRTVLLETGNWTDSGHPTGRRVTFVNSFAIEHHFFNFSTTGQWLWDTLEILVPSGQDPFPVTQAILKVVTDTTATDAQLAEEEWKRATTRYGIKPFSAIPSIDVRPTWQGINVIVRYITRASERYEIRARLYQTAVDILHNRIAPGSLPTGAKTTAGL